MSKLTKAIHTALYVALTCMMLLCSFNATLHADMTGAFFFLAMAGAIVALYFLSKYAHSI